MKYRQTNRKETAIHLWVPEEEQEAEEGSEAAPEPPRQRLDWHRRGLASLVCGQGKPRQRPRASSSLQCFKGFHRRFFIQSTVTRGGQGCPARVHV